jgi:hypothetical protein
MEKFIIILIFFIIILFLYWCYQEYIERTKLKKLSESIKNNITITLYNIHQYLNLPNNIKKILLDIAKKYNHNDIINLLTSNN